MTPFTLGVVTDRWRLFMIIIIIVMMMIMMLTMSVYYDDDDDDYDNDDDDEEEEDDHFGDVDDDNLLSGMRQPVAGVGEALRQLQMRCNKHFLYFFIFYEANICQIF